MDAIVTARIDEFRYVRGTSPAIRSIDLNVRTGEFVVITGPAGAGKTTLCYCLSGIIPHFTAGTYKGDVTIKGRDLSHLRLPELAGLVGLLLQRPENQLFNLTVREDVSFGPENLCLDRDTIRSRLNDSLSFVGMTHLAERMCHGLSGGEAQRIVLSCVLAMDPDLFILDQPAAQLDPVGRQQVYENIFRLNREAGKTIIVVEDRLGDLLPFASRMILMSQGEIMKDARPAEFFSDEDVLRSGIRVPAAVTLRHVLEQGVPDPDRLCLTHAGVVRQDGPLVGSVRPSGKPPGAEDKSATSKHSGLRTVAEVQDLWFQYPRSERWALQAVSLAFKAGELSALIGENGAGKTSLAKQLAGLLKPTRGRALIDGQDIARLSGIRLSDSVGYLFQDPDCQIFCNSVFDEVAFSLKLRKLPARQIEERVKSVLDKLGLLAERDNHPYRLSRGQRQRLALATILVHEPRILVADEPSTGLDYRETLETLDLLAQFCQSGGTVIMISHDMEMVLRYAHRSIVMAGGRVLVDTPTAEIEAHQDALTKAAVEPAPLLCNR